MHIGSQLFELEPFRAAVAAIADSAVFPRSTSAAASASRTRPTTRGRRRSTTTRGTKVEAVREVLGDGVRIVDEPGRALVANSTVTLYTVHRCKRNVSR